MKIMAETLAGVHTHTHTHTNVLVNNKKEYKKFQNSITMLVSKLDTG